MALLLADTFGFGQTVKSVAVEVGYDDNAFRNYRSLSDYITQLNLYLARDVQKPHWTARIYYDGRFDIFAENSDRFSHYHKMGLLVTRGFADSELNAGGYVALNRNLELYNYTNYFQLSGFANYKVKPGESIIAQLGYIGKYRNYENLPAFNHFEHQVFGRLSWFLPTKTSMIFYARFGLKDYAQQTVSTIVPDSSGERGHGPGRPGGGSVVVDEYETPTASQFIASVKLGQSITSTTGVSFEYLRRSKLDDSGRSAYNFDGVWSYSSEDELYDDPYGYESHELSAGITQMLPRQTIVKAGYDYYRKNYSAAALDLTGQTLLGEPLRSYTRRLVWVQLSKRFAQKSRWRNVDFSLGVYHLINHSNDLYFDYTATAVTFGAAVSF